MFPASRVPTFHTKDISSNMYLGTGKMNTILLFCYGATRRYSDETCFMMETFNYFVVDCSKLLVFEALLKSFFSIEQSTPVSISTT